MAGRVLICATSATKLLDGRETGCWVEEVASPYFIWREVGFTVDIASVAGGEIPWDAASTKGDFYTSEAKAFYEDESIQKLIRSTPSAQEVLSRGIDGYDALFIPGGHGIVFDGSSEPVKQLVEAFWRSGKVVSAVCHGPAALVTPISAEGEPIVKGKQVAGFSNTEEQAVGKEKAVPFLLEDKLKEQGGDYVRGPDWQPFAVASGKLITGQNPQSSRRVAELVCAAVLPGVSEPSHGKVGTM